MTEKYYTPEIEEFHVGFEYEYNPSLTKRSLWYLDGRKSDEWIKESFSAGNGVDGESEISEIESLISDNAIRVKHLDREDIESLGWECKEGFLFSKGNFLMVQKPDNKIYIAMNHPTLGEISHFGITCLNKSELQFLMKRLGI